MPNQTLHFELGRSLVAQCGSLISRVLYIKPAEKTSFMILDAGMTELIRPALYRSHHFIQNLSSQEGSEVYDVVGPICETSDAFARSLSLPKAKEEICLPFVRPVLMEKQWLVSIIYVMQLHVFLVMILIK